MLHDFQPTYALYSSQCIQRLAAPVFHRPDTDEVSRALACLEVPSGLFADFYTAYNGAFSSRRTGFELLDLVSGDESVETNTLLCRNQYGFPKRYLVISGLLGGGVLVYDVETDGVYNVDFEGGTAALIAGVANPEWPTFSEFLEFYFAEKK